MLRLWCCQKVGLQRSYCNSVLKVGCYYNLIWNSLYFAEVFLDTVIVSKYCKRLERKVNGMRDCYFAVHWFKCIICLIQQQFKIWLYFQKLNVGHRVRRILSTESKPAMGNFNDIPPKAKKIVGYWLLGCAGAVFGTVMVGGITRFALWMSIFARNYNEFRIYIA